MNTRERTSTTTGSTFRPGLSSVYSPIKRQHDSPHIAPTPRGAGTECKNVLSIVLLLPPAPALRVLVGLAFAILSFWSAAARLRITVLGPPGGAGDEGRTLAPVAAPAGESARGEDCTRRSKVSSIYDNCPSAMRSGVAISLPS